MMEARLPVLIQLSNQMNVYVQLLAHAHVTVVRTSRTEQLDPDAPDERTVKAIAAGQTTRSSSYDFPAIDLLPNFLKQCDEVKTEEIQTVARKPLVP